jgi:CrcB protein
VVYLAVALGGALGAVLRWALGDAVPDGAGFPWTTFVINVTGSLVLAWLPAIGAVRRRQVLLGTGFCGGFTTYSAFAVQTYRLDPLRGTAYAVLTIGVLLGVCAIGVVVA